MGHDEIIRCLNGLSKIVASDIDPASMVEALKEESDRGAIILIATLVDDALRGAIEKKLVGLNKDEAERFFRYDVGIAGTFSNRIVLAQALGILDRPFRRKFDIIRTVRNACAHASSQLSFSSPEIIEAIGYIAETSPDTVAGWPLARRRGLFLILCSAYALTMSGTEPEGMEHRLKPLLQSLLGSDLA